MWINQCLAFLERWALYDCPHFTIAISDTILNSFFPFILSSYCFCFVCCLLILLLLFYFFLYNSRSKVMLMLTSTSSRNIQLLHFFSIFHRKIDLTTCGTWISYDKQCLQQDQMRHEGWVTHKKQCVKLTHQVATWLHNKFCTPSP